jgi:hypothetical protein
MMHVGVTYKKMCFKEKEGRPTKAVFYTMPVRKWNSHSSKRCCF